MNTPNSELELKIVKARTAMLIDQPFFGSLALRLKMRVMPEFMRAWFIDNQLVPTLAVDGKHIFYSEQYVESLTMPLMKSALAHEVIHCAFDHIGRRAGRDEQRWLQAIDYATNLVLKDAGFEIGDGWLLSQQYAGMSADEIYNLLPPGGGGGPPQCWAMDGHSDDIDVVKNDWKVASVQAATHAKMEGKLPGCVSRFLEELLETKQNWRDRLRRFFTEKAKDEYCWSRPNRRYLSAGLYLPTLFSETMGTVIVVTDDSGSIGDEILRKFGGETEAIRVAVRPRETFVLSCDAAVNHVTRLEPDEPLKLENHGGGGTDFRPPFKWVEKHNIKPACLIYLTDMYGTFPDAPPDYPVMWCAISDVVAPWGETIKIED